MRKKFALMPPATVLEMMYELLAGLDQVSGVPARRSQQEPGHIHAPAVEKEMPSWLCSPGGLRSSSMLVTGADRSSNVAVLGSAMTGCPG